MESILPPGIHNTHESSNFSGLIYFFVTYNMSRQPSPDLVIQSLSSQLRSTSFQTHSHFQIVKVLNVVEFLFKEPLKLTLNYYVG